MWLEGYFEPCILSGELLESVREHEKTLETDSENESALQNLVVYYTASQHAELAYKHGKKYLSLIKSGYEKSSLYFNFGRLEMSLQNFEKAIEWYLKSVAEPDDHKDEAYFELSGCYWHLKQYEAAEKYLLKAIEWYQKEDDDTNEYWEKMGMLYGVMENYEQSLHYFTARLKDAPDSWYVLYGIALSHQKMGDDLRALSYYYKALKVNPNEPNIYNNLGVIAIEFNGKIPEAIQHLEKAFELVGDNNELKGIICMNLSRLHNKLANYDQAEQYRALLLESLGFPVEWVEDDDEEDGDDDNLV